MPLLWQRPCTAPRGMTPEHAYLRSVPTADMSVTMGMSVGVLLLCLYYSIKIKGLGGWLHEL